MLRWFLLLALAGAPWVVSAQSEAEVRAQAQASMVVRGSLDVESDGVVSAVAFEKEDALPPYVVEAARNAVRTWRFEPEIRDGAAIPFRVRLSMRVVAERSGADDFTIRVVSAALAEDLPEAQRFTARRMAQPEYPAQALHRDASGIVYVLLRIERDGRVSDSAIEQVNLRAVADGGTMAMLRKQFSQSVLRTSRRWIFQPPTEGKDAAQPSWTLRVPVSFVMQGVASADQYGAWMAYVPGPRQRVPWLQGVAQDANDALDNGEVQLVGAGPRLRTPLQPAG